MKTTVNQLLGTKVKSIWSIEQYASVFEALEIMAARNVGALVVINEGQLVGIFSERDYARKVILLGRSSRDTHVSDVMTRDVITITRDTNIHECMQLFTDKHIRHLPVMEEGVLLGVISIGDVVSAFISEQQFTINQLENYIQGH